MKNNLRKMVFKPLTLTILLVSFGINSKAQNLRYVDTDTIKRPWLAVTEVVGLNVGVNRFNFYARPDQDFSTVGFNSWTNNIKHDLTWDWNGFTVNHIGHPYQGSLYYNSARSLGMNYWQSGGYALLGSATWEYFGEKHPPSGNDLITTTMGGMFLGEVLHRFSDLIWDGSAFGFERVVREFFGFVVNPLGGFNRFLTGKMSQYERAPGYFRPVFKGSISLGTGNFTQSAISTNTAEGILLDLSLNYGDPFDKRVIKKKPFDIFTLDIAYHNTKIDTSQTTFLAVYGHGNIFLTDISNEEKNSEHALGIFHIYDYINVGGDVEIGDMGVTAGLLSKFPLSDKVTLKTEVMFGAIVLGGSNSEVVDVALFSDDPTDARDYILGPGSRGKISVELEAQKFGSLKLRTSRFDIFVASGPAGRERLNILDFEYKLPIYKALNIGAKYTFYDRKATYDKFEGTEEAYTAFRTFISLRF